MLTAIVFFKTRAAIAIQAVRPWTVYERCVCAYVGRPDFFFVISLGLFCNPAFSFLVPIL